MNPFCLNRRARSQLAALADCYQVLLDDLEDLRQSTEMIYEELSPVLEDLLDSLSLLDDSSSFSFAPAPRLFPDAAGGTQGTASKV